MVGLYGREKIYSTVDEITAENVVSELNEALALHFLNMEQEDYLYWYRRGRQPILERTKVVREEINNKVVENVAGEITAFKNGFFLTNPCNYISRKDDETISEKVKDLNEYLYLSGKHDVDNNIVDWFHTVGVGVCYIASSDEEGVPVKAYSLDPRDAFVVYSRQVGNEPLFGVNITVTSRVKKRTNETIRLMFDVITKTKIFHVSGGVTCRIVTYERPIMGTAIAVESVEANPLGEIPIIEYTYDRNRMSAFESVIPLLDAINNVQSNRLDGIEQFIQSLMVFYNCTLGDDEDGNPLSPAYIREQGAIFLKSVGQDKADLKILTEQLDQQQTQTLVEDLMKQVCDIAGIPFTAMMSSSSDNVGATYLRQGWASADTYARNTEDLFKESNRRFDRIFLKILRLKNMSTLEPSDIELQFTRGEMDNLLVKTQGALNLKQLGLSPEIVLARSGVSYDPVGDVAKSKKYIDAAFGVTAQPTPNENMIAQDENNRVEEREELRGEM